ncbi:hypothetical protein AB0G85_37595 [Streptomyces sioyaensis]|uniref:hypothetical protein n=1 Tax=Streptomyces sioyaensis TaxID=67364 RepID=UPI00340C940E
MAAELADERELRRRAEREHAAAQQRAEDEKQRAEKMESVNAKLAAELRSFGRQIDERDTELRELRSRKTPARRKKAAERDTPEPSGEQ